MTRQELKLIDPRVHPRYSANLYRWLTGKKMRNMVHLLDVYRCAEVGSVWNNVLWIGFKDEQGWFIGVRLNEVLCIGEKTETAAYAPVFASTLSLLPSFWDEYKRIGRCAIDPTHRMPFYNEASRWHYAGIEMNVRVCLWCGEYSEARVHRTKVVTETEWVPCNLAVLKRNLAH